MSSLGKSPQNYTVRAAQGKKKVTFPKPRHKHAMRHPRCEGGGGHRQQPLDQVHNAVVSNEISLSFERMANPILGFD